MTDLNQNLDQAKDMLNVEQKDMQKLPQMLNVLTILTYIGCGLGALGILLGFLGIGFLSSMGPKSVQGAEIASTVSKYATISLIVSLVGIALCFWGAMKMRNLQKQGFYIYIAGQLIPVIAGFIFAGSLGAAGISVIGGLIIPIIFIVLYATQLKELK